VSKKKKPTIITKFLKIGGGMEGEWIDGKFYSRCPTCGKVDGRDFHKECYEKHVKPDWLNKEDS